MSNKPLKATESDDKVFEYLFIVPAFPIFLVVFGVHLYLGTGLQNAVVHALMAALTGPFGVAATVIWLSSVYSPLAVALVTLFVLLVVGGAISVLACSAYMIYSFFLPKPLSAHSKKK